MLRSTLLDDPHLHDRGFWKEVEHPELGRSFVYPGEPAIYPGRTGHLVLVTAGIVVTGLTQHRFETVVVQEDCAMG